MIMNETVTDTLRREMERSGQTRYMIAKATGIPQSTLSRFHNGGALRSGNLDTLAEHLGLELRPKRRERKG